MRLYQLNLHLADSFSSQRDLQLYNRVGWDWSLTSMLIWILGSGGLHEDGKALTRSPPGEGAISLGSLAQGNPHGTMMNTL